MPDGNRKAERAARGMSSSQPPRLGHGLVSPVWAWGRLGIGDRPARREGAYANRRRPRSPGCWSPASHFADRFCSGPINTAVSYLGHDRALALRWMLLLHRAPLTTGKTWAIVSIEAATSWTKIHDFKIVPHRPRPIGSPIAVSPSGFSSTLSKTYTCPCTSATTTTRGATEPKSRFFYDRRDEHAQPWG